MNYTFVHQDGLAFWFKEQSVKYIQEIRPLPTMEVLALLLDVKGEPTLLLLLDGAGGPIDSFITDLMELLVGSLLFVKLLEYYFYDDFNLDQLLGENVNRMHLLLNVLTCINAWTIQFMDKAALPKICQNMGFL